MVYTYNKVFEDAQYRGISKKIAQYFQEAEKSSLIPFITPDVPDALQYRHIKLSKSKVSEGITEDWSPQGFKAVTEHGFIDFTLTAREMHLTIPKKDINNYNDRNILADKYNAQIKQFALDVDYINFIGNYVDLDNLDACIDAGGLIGQATGVIDLNGTDSNLSTKSDVWAGIKKMIDAIPFRMREPSPPMLLYMTENLAAKLGAPDRVYTDSVEQDFIKRLYVGEDALNGRRIGRIVVTNNILVPGTDTLGTHDRMLLLVPDESIVARVVSRSYSLLDEEKIMFGIHQAWGYRGSCCVFEPTGVQFSEQIVWA